VAALCEESRFAARWELERLPRYLEPGERVGVLARASSDGDEGLLVATDRRLLFLNTITGSYFIRHTTKVVFAYEEVERVELKADAIVITPRETGRPTAMQQAWRTLVQINEWLSDSSPRTARWRGLEVGSVPVQEAAALHEYLAAPGSPLEGRILDPTGVETRAALAGEPAPTAPERWSVACIVAGAAIALGSLLAFFVAAASFDLCEEQPGWFLPVVAGPLVAAVLVVVGHWGTSSLTVRKQGRWAWLPVGAAAVFIWIGLPAAC
jgi:Bacterial PH domain